MHKCWTLFHYRWSVSWYNYFGKLAVSTKTKYMHTYDPAIPLLPLYPTEVCTYVYWKTCAQMFTTTLAAIAKNRKLSTTVEEWIKILWNIHWNTIHGIPFRNENEWSRTTCIIWMNLAGLLLSQRSQTQNNM